MRLILLALLVTGSICAAAQSGKFVGVTMDGVSNSGKLFSFKPDGSGVSVTKEFGVNRSGESISSQTLTPGPGGDLYGLTLRGASGRGTLFKITADDHSFVTVFDFPLVGSAGYPSGQLVLAPNGYFY